MATETEWRRSWSPTLAACPWLSIDVDGEKLLVKMKFAEKSYEVLMTDLTSCWFESLEEKALKNRIELLNPRIEAPVTKILDQIKMNINSPGKETKLTVRFKNLADSDGQKLTLMITSSLAGMPFHWNFHAEPADSSVVRDHLTVPLLSMVSELFRRQQELYALLAAKDKEIEDYKFQGVRVCQKHIETTKFDTIAFKNTMATSKGFEERVRKHESSTFNADGQELYTQIATKHAWLVHQAKLGDNDDDVPEEESIPMSNSNQGAQSVKQSWANRLPPSLAPSKGTSSPAKTATESPTRSPAKSPGSNSTASDTSPSKDLEKLRREELEKRLELEEQKKQDKKKKKKLGF